MNIVFDFGAVLFEWQPAQVIAQYFPDADSAQMTQEVFSHADWHAFDAGLVSAQVVVERTHLRTQLSLESLQAMVAQIPQALKPIKTSVQLLEQLKQEKSQRSIRSLSFLSNMPEPYARVLEQQHLFLQSFDGGVFSGDVKLAKPDAAIYALVEERLSAKSSDILFIDDHPANIAAAQSRGWQTIHLTEPSKLPELLLAKLAQTMP
jgi:putative hydrolase of the HAD superfamily